MKSPISLDPTHPKPHAPPFVGLERVVFRVATSGRTYYTPKEAAALLMVSPVTVREWTRKGLLRAVSTAGGHRRFLIEELRTFAAAHGIRLENETTAAATAPRRVLLVDDDVVFVTYLRQIILAASPSIQIESANDGFEAGRLTESFRPQLVVLDIQMPRIDGIELCRRLRANPTTASAELVVISNALTEENTAAVRAAGADRWLEKGASRAEILAALGLGAGAAAGAPNRQESVQKASTTNPVGTVPGAARRRGSDAD
ncbi:MAG TPA: response regulator [Steroidobacteraceae bacterium]|nr:response regulator [Steroidobacteraceae bacterium]